VCTGGRGVAIRDPRRHKGGWDLRPGYGYSFEFFLLKLGAGNRLRQIGPNTVTLIIVDEMWPVVFVCTYVFVSSVVCIRACVRVCVCVYMRIYESTGPLPAQTTLLVR
jgi:hypothetical protein